MMNAIPCTVLGKMHSKEIPITYSRFRTRWPIKPFLIERALIARQLDSPEIGYDLLKRLHENGRWILFACCRCAFEGRKPQALHLPSVRFQNFLTGGDSSRRRLGTHEEGSGRSIAYLTCIFICISWICFWVYKYASFSLMTVFPEREEAQDRENAPFFCFDLTYSWSAYHLSKNKSKDQDFLCFKN